MSAAQPCFFSVLFLPFALFRDIHRLWNVIILLLDLTPILYQLHWITELLKRIYLTLWLSTLISPFLFSSFPSCASYRFATGHIFPPLYTVSFPFDVSADAASSETSLFLSFSLSTVGWMRKASGRCNIEDWGTDRNENFIGNKKA